MKYLLLSIAFTLLTVFTFGQRVDSTLTPSDSHLTVGLKVSPPFVILEKSGAYSGVSVELFERVAHDLGYTWEYQLLSASNEQIVQNVKDGRVDIALGSFTITSDRLKAVGFTQPFYNTGLAIATYPVEKSIFQVVVDGLFSANFIKFIGSLTFLLLFMGVIFWFVERRKNDDFEESLKKGIWDGFYYSFIVMSTVGFGDKSPKTPVGKGLTMIWGIISLGITGIFIAGMASAFSDAGSQEISDISTLSKMKTGVISGSTGNQFLESEDIKCIHYNNAQEALEAIDNGELDAFVHDQPVIKYIIETNNFESTVQLHDRLYTTEYYAFPVNSNEEGLRTLLSAEIIEELNGEFFQGLLFKYNLINIE